jgi:hypothetical protein
MGRPSCVEALAVECSPTAKASETNFNPLACHRFAATRASRHVGEDNGVKALSGERYGPRSRERLPERETRRFRDLYAGQAAGEREHGRLKNGYGLKPLRVRGLAEGRASHWPHHARPVVAGARPSAAVPLAA